MNLFMLRFIGQLLLSKLLPFVPKPALMTINDTVSGPTGCRGAVVHQLYIAGHHACLVYCM